MYEYSYVFDPDSGTYIVIRKGMSYNSTWCVYLKDIQNEVMANEICEGMNSND